MSDQYDPHASYDLMYAKVGKVEEVNQGLYFEGGWEVGLIDGDVFYTTASLRARSRS